MVSTGKAVILSIVDRFSKAAHFITLEKLPMAAVTAKLLMFSGSDWVPQFTSKTWRAFCSLGAKVSLSSGFHPQTNGQTELGVRNSTSMCHHPEPCHLGGSLLVACSQVQAWSEMWLAAKDIPLKSLSHKLATHFTGPFEINSVISPFVLRLKLPSSLHIYPTFHISQHITSLSGRWSPLQGLQLPAL